MKPRPLVATVVAAVVAPFAVSVGSFGCDPPAPSPSPSNGAATTATSATTVTTATTATTATATVSASASTLPSASASASASTSGSSEKMAVTFPPKPVPLPLEAQKQGASLFAVYLYVAKANDDAYARAKAAWEATKLPIGSGEASCDQGSIEAGVPQGSWTISVYFKTKKDAEAFRDGVTPKPTALGPVKIMCAD